MSRAERDREETAVEDYAGLLAISASAVQSVGYGIYLYLTGKAIEPQPTTWFMWGSTTWIIAMLEAHVMLRHGETHWELLLLPLICGFMAFIVALRCWQRGTLRWPEEWQDQFALVVGMGLTCLGYLPGFALVEYGLIAGSTHAFMAAALLSILNFITVVEFSPLLRSTWKNPSNERALPWVIWGGAYGMLLLATALETGWSPLLVYPGMNAVLHGFVGILALPIRRTRLKQQPTE